jgi:hypothetical protein
MKRHKMLLRIIRTASIAAAILIVLELLSAAVILVFAGKNNIAAGKLLAYFPAQFRMSGSELRETVLYDSARPAEITLQADPILGFRDPRYMRRSGPNNPDLLICCLGGSTTAVMPFSNWPDFLISAARKHNVRQNIAVLNAGAPGYMSLNEHLYLTNWVIGKKKYNCGAVVSLDGVNDIHWRIPAYMYSLKYGEEWAPGYHGFHQKLEHDIRYIQTPRGALDQFAGVTASVIKNAAGSAASRLIPYTARLALAAAARVAPSSHSGGLRLSEPEIRKLRAAGATGELSLPPAVEDEIIRAFRNSLLDLAGSCNIRNIPYVSYLQPVDVARYYNNPRFSGPPPAGPAFPQSPVFSVGGGYMFNLSPIYLKSELLYSGLMKSHPGNFGSLLFLFKNKERETLYRDPIHYTAAGSELIADAIVADLLKRNIITARKSSD